MKAEIQVDENAVTNKSEFVDAKEIGLRYELTSKESLSSQSYPPTAKLSSALPFNT